MAYWEVYRTVHAYFPSMRDFEDLLAGCVKAGMLILRQGHDGGWLYPGNAPT
jgi:hypothetical protein